MKKFLSLVLALVMTMSLVTISAGAKDFTDADKVNYDEAIAVLSAVKVIDGYTDGSFKPQTPLNRGQAAKIICNLVLGPTTAAELSATVAPFSDVPANNIFAGYITYCANEGIICGYGDGTFRPTASLTGYAFMKMLLGALGYDADIEGYNNPGSFGIQVAKQAIGIGLNKGLKDTFDGNKTVTREEACLYALNTLKATMVEYDQKIIANVNGAQITVGTSLAKEVKWNIAEKKNDGNIKADQYVQFAEKYFPNLELETGNGMYGRPTNVWKLKKSEIGAFASIEPTYVYTESTKGKDIYKDLGKIVCDTDEYDWTVYINGKEVDGKVDVPTKDGSHYVYTDNGSVTEIYVEDSLEKGKPGTVTVCEINYYLGEVSKVKTDDDGEYITVKALSKEPNLDDRTFYVEGYEEDDYVVFTVDYNDDEDFVIGEVMEPVVASGEVTRVDKNTGSSDEDYDNSYVRLDGEKYSYASKMHNVYDLDTGKQVHPTLNEKYNLYLTPEGFILGYALADEAETKYLYVEDSDEELGDWVAKVVLADGTKAKIDLKNDYVDVKGGNDYAIKWVKANGQDFTANERIEKVRTNIDKHVFAYTVNDKDEYTLIETNHLCYDTVDTQTTVTGVEIHNGKAYIEVGEDKIIVDRDTVFVDIDGKTAYTGYDEVPNVSDADIAYAKDGRVAEIVFIVNGEKYDENSTYFILKKNDRESLNKDDDFWEYSEAYVNGEKQKVVVAYDALQKLDNGEWVKDVDKAGKKLDTMQLFKAVKSDDNGYFTAIRPVTLADEYVTAVANGAFWTTKDKKYLEKDEVKYDCDKETVFVTIEAVYDKNGKFKEWDISDGRLADMFEGIDDDGMQCKVSVIESDKTYAGLVYIWIDKAPVLSDDATINSIKFKGVEVNPAGYEDGKTYTLALTATQNSSNDEFKAAIECADGASFEVFWADGTTDVYEGDMDSIKDGITGLPVTLTIVCTSEDGSNTTTVKVNLSAATEVVAVELGLKDNDAHNKVAINNGNHTVTLAQGTSVTVAQLKAVLKITGAANGFDIVKTQDKPLGGTEVVPAADTDIVATGMKVVAKSAETKADVEWTITVAPSA